MNISIDWKIKRCPWKQSNKAIPEKDNVLLDVYTYPFIERQVSIANLSEKFICNRQKRQLCETLSNTAMFIYVNNKNFTNG